MIQSMMTNDKEGKIRRQEAEQRLKKVRRDNIVNEASEKDDKDYIDWDQENNELQQYQEKGKDPVEQQEKQLEDLKRIFDKLRLKTELDDIDKILEYYKVGGQMNEALY